ncbi:putative mitochondrial import protein [Chloropicon roscoffensis]|uniref:Mitochondrial import protein n=1 Tax=Chloropicon roscoffensis TaxID=1461544 RepID=A0AAX4P6Q1_9CHLO
MRGNVGLGAGAVPPRVGGRPGSSGRRTGRSIGNFFASHRSSAIRQKRLHHTVSPFRASPRGKLSARSRSDDDDGRIKFTSTSSEDEQLKREVDRDGSGSPRRTAKVAFTCDRCGGRTIRDVNPLALAKGTIFAQCSHCEKYHQLVDNLELIEEYNLKDEE